MTWLEIVIEQCLSEGDVRNAMLWSDFSLPSERSCNKSIAQLVSMADYFWAADSE